MATLRTRRFTLPLLLLGAAPALASASDGEGLFAAFARELGLAKDPSAPRPCTLATLRKTPEAYRGVRVTFTVQMHERTRFWNPFFTRFTPDNYVNFSAWGDEQRLWTPADYEADFPLLFVERRSETASTALTAETYARYQVTAVVRDTFRGMPWIEVTKMTRLSERMTVGTLVHGARGRKWMESGKWTLAASEFERAITDDLPSPARVGLLKDLSVCTYASGDYEKTRELLLAAVDLDPKDLEVNAALESLLAEEERREAAAEAEEEKTEEEPAEEKPEPAQEPPSSETQDPPPGEGGGEAGSGSSGTNEPPRD